MPGLLNRATANSTMSAAVSPAIFNDVYNVSRRGGLVKTSLFVSLESHHGVPGGLLPSHETSD